MMIFDPLVFSHYRKKIIILSSGVSHLKNVNEIILNVAKIHKEISI